MKNASVSAILLTFLMLLLVLGAAVVFLLQGRSRLDDEITRLQEEREGLRSDLELLQSQAAGREMALATSTAVVATQEAELTAQQAALDEAAMTRAALFTERDALAEELATRTAEATPSPDPPYVNIAYPQEGDILQAGTPLEIVILMVDEVGIETLRLEIDEDSLEIAGGGATEWVLPYTPPAALTAGPHTITATVTNTMQLQAESTVSFTVVSAPAPAEPAEEEEEAPPGDGALLNTRTFLVALPTGAVSPVEPSH